MPRTVAGTPANPLVQFATLTIEGEQQYRLAFDFNAIAEAETAAGCNLLSGLQNLSDLTAMQLRGLLYAALRKAQPRLTIQAAGALIRLDTLAPITLALAEAYALSMPKKKADPIEADPAASDEAQGAD
jgi:hypothetical protein